MTQPDSRQWELGAQHREANAFIQWKGTDVCMDLRCECGGGGHVDAEFAYAVKCPACGAIWEMPNIVFLRKAAKSDCFVVAGED